MANLTEQQRFVVEKILEGHNICITGQAGVGKTFLIRNVVGDLKFVEKKYALLCTTGIACMQYFDLGATTVHSWAGLLDGRYSNDVLKELVLTDDKYGKVRDNIKKCEIIIIDEMSMLSKKDFEQFELVCRNVKGNTKVFGGIQIVASGDFFQLPPVDNDLYKDSGEFCFESKLWHTIFAHRINLQEVMRQTEPEFIKAVRETATGTVSDETHNFLKSLNRDLPEKSKPVHLFARNIDAAIYNSRKLNELNATGKVYTALKNTGRPKYLNKILSPNHLSLKVCCPVILLRNLGAKLVNGLCGHVKDLHDDYITVYFDKLNETHKIQRHKFSVYDTKRNITVAERVQFPLQLGYALTIHKAQGMTLDFVCVHCNGIFLPGQLSVALGRAKSAEGVQLQNYARGLCPQPKSTVTNFYGIESKQFSNSVSDCCPQNEAIDLMDIVTDDTNDSDSDNSDFEANDLNELENIDISSIALLPSDFCIDDIIKTVMVDNPVTPQQTKTNEICSSLSPEFLEIFLAKQYSTITGIIDDKMEDQHTTPQVWASVLSSYHLYVTSEEFKLSVPLLYEYNTNLSDDHR